MPINRRAKRYIKRGQSSRNASVQLLRNLVANQVAEMRHALPRIPDVKQMLLRRKAISQFNVICQEIQITTSTTIPTSVGFYFALTPAAAAGGVIGVGPFNTTEFTALFDQYRIMQVTANIYPDGVTESDLIYTTIDYDDANPFNTVSDAQQFGTTLVTDQTSGYFQRVINPRLATAVYGAGVFTSFGTGAYGQWVDAASPAVQHYGLKLITNATSSVTHYRISFSMVLQCRSNR